MEVVSYTFASGLNGRFVRLEIIVAAVDTLLIVGGGIAGMALAIGLKRAGIRSATAMAGMVTVALALDSVSASDAVIKPRG